MSATVVELFSRLPYQRTAPAAAPLSESEARTLREAWADKAFAEVIARCDRKTIPRANAVVQAQTCRNSVLAGHETESAVRRAVDRAFRSAFPDNTPPSAA